MTGQAPVADWMADFDHFDERWVADPFALWDEMREKGPIAATERYNGFYFPLTWDAARQICFDTEHFSTNSYSITGSDPLPPNFAPPLTADPPDHRSARRLLTPAFSLPAVTRLEPSVLAVCEQRLDAIEGRGRVDAVSEYARHIPARVIASLLGITDDEAIAVRTSGNAAILSYAQDLVASARDRQADNVITMLLDTRENGRPLETELIQRLVFLIMVAGMDNMQMIISASLWHLATHSNDLRRLVENPALIATATDEFLRLYAPATLARIVKKETEVCGCRMEPGRRVVIPIAAANRDPEQFTDPSRCIVDRPDNLHATFGFGIHRCIAEKLARMQLTTALRQWIRRIPAFTLDNEQPVQWTHGHSRGPRQLHLLFGSRAAEKRVCPPPAC